MSIDDACQTEEIIVLKASKSKVILDLYNKLNPNSPVPYAKPQVVRMSEQCNVCPYMLSIDDEHYCIREEIEAKTP